MSRPYRCLVADDHPALVAAVADFLESHGFLKHHRVEAPSARGYFIDLRYPHATAVLTDTGLAERELL